MMTVTMAHAGGGVEMARLIQEIFLPCFGGAPDAILEDAAVVPGGGDIAFTTDSYVVRPLFFPGGDIGRLSVCGTVNDLLTSGAEPRYLSAGFILEEGLPLGELRRVCESMAEAAREAGVRIVTGDTKVVEGDKGMNINTAGVGLLERPPISIRDAREGDAILVTGTLGDHHACILGFRMGIESVAESDAAPLCGILHALAEAKVPLHGVRDITRGGLATILHEIAHSIGLAPVVREERVPVSPAVRSFARVLGLDPLYMANEGKALILVPPDMRDKALSAIRGARYGADCACIGFLEPGAQPVLETRFGGRRILAPLRGAGLPRIC